MTVLLVTSL